MKKGVSLPTNFIVIIALAVIVLLIVVFFIMGAERGVTPSLTLSQALAACDNACLTDELESKVVNVTEGVCNGDLKFLKLEFLINGERKKCPDIASCTIRTNTGDCIVTEASIDINGDGYKPTPGNGVIPPIIPPRG
jgi:hypothetical protein